MITVADCGRPVVWQTTKAWDRRDKNGKVAYSGRLEPWMDENESRGIPPMLLEVSQRDPKEFFRLASDGKIDSSKKRENRMELEPLKNYVAVFDSVYDGPWYVEPANVEDFSDSKEFTSIPKVFLSTKV